MSDYDRFELGGTSATTSAECDTEGQRSVYNMGQFTGMGGTKVGTTMQEAEWFYSEDTSAEITTTDQQMATDQVMKKVSEVFKQYRTRA